MSLRKTCSPRAGTFLTPGHNLHKLGRGILDDATYEGCSNMNASSFLTFFHIYATTKW